jgi:transcriptional regulator with XRE-family HTH domain
MLALKFHRIERDLSQRDLSRLTGVPHAHICNIETGRLNPRPDELKKIGKALGIDPARLMIHVSAPGDGFEYRDAVRERQQS